MAPPRKAERAGWPIGLFESRPGYYVYTSPVTRRTTAIGRVELSAAIEYASDANQHAGRLKREQDDLRVMSPHGDRDKRGLFEHQHVAAHAMTFDHIVGVYLLLDADEVVYVGKSVTIMRRLVAHKHEGTKDFNRVFIVECHEHELDKLERLYIAKYRPKYNATAPAPGEHDVAWRGMSVRELFGEALHPAHRN